LKVVPAEARQQANPVNLKKDELPVKQIVSGEVIKPSGTLANQKSLQYYYQFAKDENLVAKPSAKL
jgi:acetoacetyl-CoA synthetase